MNKKGLINTTDSGFSLFRVLLTLTIISIFTIFMIIAFNKTEHSISGVYPEIEYRLLDRLVLYSSDCLAYQDQTSKRVKLGVIDKNKFSGSRLSECLNFDHMTLELILDVGENTYNIESSSLRSSRIIHNTYLVKLHTGETGILTSIQYR